MGFLRYRLEKKSVAGRPEYAILTIYADSFFGVEQGLRKSLLLRRVSQATFPFLVSHYASFNLHAIGIATSQVVLAESGIITHLQPT